MLKIAICDGNIEDLMNTEKMLLRFHKHHPQERCEITKYSDSNILYKRIESGELADIYILDVLMSVKSGIDIGRKIRRLDAECVIIYTASTDNFAIEAYRLHAVRYLLKPLTEEEFSEAIAYAYSFINRKEDPLYLLKTPEGMVSLAHSKIAFVENRSRVLHVHLSDGRVMKSVFVRKSFEVEINGLVKSPFFLQVHKSFIVNLRHVEKLTSDYMEMIQGDCIPVSKRRYAEVKQRYLLYTADRYR